MVLTTPYKTVLDDDEVILFMGKFNKWGKVEYYTFPVLTGWLLIQ